MAGASGRGEPLALEEPPPPRPAPQENRLGDPDRLAQIHFKILRGHTDIVSSCHFCFEDTKILSCSYDKTVKLWDVEKSVPVQVFEEEHLAPISECSLTPDNKRVITSSYDKTVKAWDMETGKMLWTVDQEGLVTSCDISCDGKYVVSGLDMENAICVIDAVNAITVAYVQAFSFESNLITETAVQQVHQHIFKDLILGYTEHFQFPLMPAGVEDAQLNMVSASTDANSLIGNIYKEDCFTVCHKDHHRSTVTRCCFDPDNERVCSVSCDKTIKLWDIRAQSTTITIDEAHNNVISDCCFSIDGHYLCTASWDKTLKIWDVRIGEFRCHGPICLNQGHKGSVSSCIFSKDASLVVSGAYDKTIALWDAGAGYKKLALKDATLRLWNIEKADHVPEAIGNRNTRDSKIAQCEECEKPFSLLQCDDSEAVTKCVFCRLASPSRNILPLPPTIAPDL